MRRAVAAVAAVVVFVIVNHLLGMGRAPHNEQE